MTRGSPASGRRSIRCWSCPTTADGESTPSATISPGRKEAMTCKVKGFDGYLYEPCWINPIRCRGQRHQERRYRQGVQRARQRAVRRPGVREDHAGSGLHRPRRPGRLHHPGQAGPRRRHQHHHPGGADLQARGRPGHQRLPGRGGEGQHAADGRMEEETIPMPSSATTTPASGLRFNAWVEEER